MHPKILMGYQRTSKTLQSNSNKDTMVLLHKSKYT